MRVLSVIAVVVGMVIGWGGCDRRSSEEQPAVLDSNVVFSDLSPIDSGRENRTPTVDEQDLLAILPGHFPDAESAYPTVGRIQGRHYQIITVHRDYRFRNSGKLGITVTDFGHRIEFQEFYPGFFQQAEKQNDTLWRLYHWDGQKRSGRLIVWTQGRLGVELEAERLPLYMGNLWEIYRQMVPAIDSVFSSQ